MPQQSVFAAELSWPDYDARVRDGTVPILMPIGSMEQHGHHMPMHVDVLLPVEFARRVAGRDRRAGRAALHLRLQVASEVRRRQSSARHHQPRRRDPGRRTARRHQGIRPPRRPPDLPGQRPFREFLVHHRGHRPGAARTALGRHRRHEDRRAVLLGLRRQGDDRTALSRRLRRLGPRTWRRARNLADAGALSRTRSASSARSTMRRQASRPTTSTRRSRNGRRPAARCPRPRRRQRKRARSCWKSASTASSRRWRPSSHAELAASWRQQKPRPRPRLFCYQERDQKGRLGGVNPRRSPAASDAGRDTSSSGTRAVMRAPSRVTLRAISRTSRAAGCRAVAADRQCRPAACPGQSWGM